MLNKRKDQMLLKKEIKGKMKKNTILNIVKKKEKKMKKNI